MVYWKDSLKRSKSTLLIRMQNTTKLFKDTNYTIEQNIESNLKYELSLTKSNDLARQKN